MLFKYIFQHLNPKSRVLARSKRVLYQSHGGELFFSQGDGYTLCSLYQHLICWNPRVCPRKIMVDPSQLAAPGFVKLTEVFLCHLHKAIFLWNKKKKSPFVPYSVFTTPDSS